MAVKKSRFDTSFKDWIDKHGSPKLAKTLKTNASTIRQWRMGLTLPRAFQMKKIKELTKGKVGYTEIIEGSCSPVRSRGSK